MNKVYDPSEGNLRTEQGLYVIRQKDLARKRRDMQCRDIKALHAIIAVVS
jgi:hypothetical protein